MKSTTSIKICTALDMNVVAGACLFGVISGIVGLHQTQEMNRRLKEVSIYVPEFKKRVFLFHHFTQNTKYNIFVLCVCNVILHCK